MNNTRRLVLSLYLFAGLLWAAPAAAFDWKAPVQTVEHLLDRARQIARPGGIAVAPGDPAQSRPTTAPGPVANPAANKPATGRSASTPGAPPVGPPVGPPAPTPSSGQEASPAPSRESHAAETRAAAEPAPLDSAETVLLEKILLSPEPYSYQTAGRRDPFVSLVDDGDGGDGNTDSAKDEQLTVRGILWGENDRFALVENGAGSSFILRQGDHCGRFTVTRILPASVEVYSSQYGVGKTTKLPLNEEKGSKHALPQR